MKFQTKASVFIVSLLFTSSIAAATSLTLNDSTKVKRSGDASFSVWANQSGNVLSTGFISSLAHGGFIGHDVLDPVLEAHEGGMGFFGGSIGWEKKWAAKPFKGGKWALCGSMGSEMLYDSRWTSDMFELIFYGNGGHTGRVDVLSGTGMRMAEYNRFGLGFENTKTRQRLEVSLVQRLAGAEWSIPYGYFSVSENADSLDTYLQTEARLHALDGPSTMNVPFGDSLDLPFGFLPAYGIGLSGSLPLASETLPIRFEINFSDFGILFEPQGSSVAWFQEGIATTGLPVFGDSLTWESVVEGNISTDSLLLTGSSVKRMTLLPYRLSADFIYEPSPDVMIELSVETGGWMPEPLFTAGVGWTPFDRLAFGVQAKYGGWGKMRPVVWAQLKVTCRRMLVVEIEDPMGFLIGNESSDFTYNRGISIRLERLAGNGWDARGGRFKSTCKR